jgi:hypothetical protein
MTNRPPVGRGLFYTRDSGGKPEDTPGEFVRWGRHEADDRGVAFTGSPEKTEAMIQNGRFEDGDLFLDYGFKGNLLQRPGGCGASWAHGHWGRYQTPAGFRVRVKG